MIQYEYDLLGRRAGKIVNDIAASETRTVKYAYDGDDILYEFDGDNDLQARHTHGPGVDDPLYTQAVGDSGGPGDFYYYHKDGMNSVREITDENGEVVQRLDYDSFGNILSINGCVYDPAANTITTGTGGGGSSTETYAPPHDFFHTYAYTGRQWDPETGLYYYRARYYDASIGRFISEDPQWNVNLYEYVKNNPLNFMDPSGMWIREFLNEIFSGFGDTLHKALSQWSDLWKNVRKHPAANMLISAIEMRIMSELFDKFIYYFGFIRQYSRNRTVAEGIVFVYEDEELKGKYRAVSGPWGKGPINNGIWETGHHHNMNTDIEGMMLPGGEPGPSWTLKPQSDREGIAFHFDQTKGKISYYGTRGCIGFLTVIDTKDFFNITKGWGKGVKVNAQSH